MWYCEKINRECFYYEKCNNSHVEKEYWPKILKMLGSNSKFKKAFLRRNREKILLELWIKKVWKIEQIKLKNLASLINKYKNTYEYWSYTFNDTKYKKEGDKIVWINPKDKTFTLILSKDENDIKLYTKFDNSLDEKPWVVATWLLLWYPKCCVLSEYEKCRDVGHIKKINYDWDNIIFEEWIECKLLNPYIRLYLHLWCSNKCIDTIEQCEKVLKYLEKKYWEEIGDYFFNMVNKKEYINK